MCVCAKSHTCTHIRTQCRVVAGGEKGNCCCCFLSCALGDTNNYRYNRYYRCSTSESTNDIEVMFVLFVLPAAPLKHFYYIIFFFVPSFV